MALGTNQRWRCTTKAYVQCRSDAHTFIAICILYVFISRQLLALEFRSKWM